MMLEEETVVLIPMYILTTEQPGKIGAPLTLHGLQEVGSTQLLQMMWQSSWEQNELVSSCQTRVRSRYQEAQHH